MSELISRRKDIKWGTNAIKGSGNPNFNGGKYLDEKGYVRVRMPEHPASVRGYVYEHRLVMEDYLNRYLESWETVHHINEVKVDNRVDNLFLTTFPEHSAIHRAGKNVSLERRAKLRKNIREKRKIQGARTRDRQGKFTKEENPEDSICNPEEG